MGTKGKIAIVGVIAIALVVAGVVLFPVPEPGVHLSANYGGSSPEPFAKLGPIYITNTLITSWISILVLVVLFFLATRKMKLVPSGLQNIAELAIEMLLGFVEGVAGEKNGRRFFPVIATIFLFVLFNAWLGLLPFFNFVTVTTAHGAEHGAHAVALLRPANTDINIPLTLALISFVAVEYWGITSLRLHYLGKFFRVGQLIEGLGHLFRGRLKSAVGAMLFGVIDIFVGLLELLSEFVRIISFTFRLFGNMTAGEVLLMMMAYLIAWVVPVVFYGLETLLGFIQALIFSSLTLVFATMAVTPHGAEHEKES